MARGRDLAGLAALAGLAYMANRKSKKSQETTGVDPDAAMGAGAISPEDARGNAEMARMAALDNPDFEPGMYTKEPGGDSAPAPARAAPTRSVAAAPARPNIVSRDEGMKNYVPRRKPPASTVSSSEEGMKNYVPRRTPQAQAPAQAAARPSAAEQKYSADPDAAMGKFVPGVGYLDVNGNIMSRNRPYTERSSAEPAPSSSSAAQRYLQGKVDRGESLSALEQAQAKRAGMPGFKKGGAVKAKKMANGGVTSASKRADGIASRGKTKCKMY